MTVLRHDLSFSASELGLGVYGVCDAAKETAKLIEEAATSAPFHQ